MIQITKTGSSTKHLSSPVRATLQFVFSDSSGCLQRRGRGRVPIHVGDTNIDELFLPLFLIFPWLLGRICCMR
uniref:Uncharacterized protein n=1 Tax=Aegilops tauschii subsp. strangulata TaxID=200361 RepID=A0A453CE86_AEGTS